MRDALATLRNTRIDGSEPLLNVHQIRTAALNVMAAPVVPSREPNRFARRYRRDPRVLGMSNRALKPERPNSLIRGGATRFARRNFTQTLSRGFTRFANFMPRARTAAMASALLMAAGTFSMPSTTHAQALDIINGRALAMHTLGTLSYRFQQNAFDMQDSQADQTRLARAQARYTLPSGALLFM